MKRHIIYNSYSGNEPYIFLRFDKADRKAASGIVNNLIEKQFRICYDEHDSSNITDSDWLAERIISSDLIIFMISADSLKSLAYRNSINYALSIKKEILCVYLDDGEIDEGTAMQLAHVPSVRLSDYCEANELCDEIVKTDHFTQEMRGEDAKSIIKSTRKKTVAIAALISVLVLFIAAAVTIAIYRINYENSLPGQIEKMTEVEYLDISNEDASMIELLKGKTVKTLVVRNMGLTDISALEYVNCEELDISENPNVNTLEPLLEIKNLKVVKVTQDMYPALTRIGGRYRFKILITE